MSVKIIVKFNIFNIILNFSKLSETIDVGVSFQRTKMNDFLLLNLAVILIYLILF